MNVLMQKARAFSELEFSKWGTAIVGPAVDARGREAVAFAKANSDKLIEMHYDEATFEMEINGERINSEDTADSLSAVAASRVILESTTLGFVETFMCCRSLLNAGLRSMSILYVEPRTYSAPRRSQVLHKRDFDLSEAVPGYRPIPGATFHLSALKPQHAVFFLGYEDHRFEVALEELQQTVRPQDCSVVLGVPAFQPGWEMNSFANNVHVIRSNDLSGGIHFCGAENPAAAAEILLEIRKSLRSDARMFLVPIGTKPMGIAAAIFAAEHEDVGLLYDHPRRRTDRSSQSSSWHLYEARFEASK